MIRRRTLLAIALSLAAIGAAYLAAFLPGGAPPWAAWLMALGTATLMTALLALGAIRDGRLGRLWIPLAATFLILAGGFGAALALPPLDPELPPNLWLGLPPGAAIILYGIGILPLLIVPIAYAATFDQTMPDEAELEALRTAAITLRREGASYPSHSSSHDPATTTSPR